jgi:hypothetical protein
MPDGAKVYSVERQNELFKQTSVCLPKLNSSKTSFFGMVIKDYQVMLLLTALSLLQGTIYTTTAYGTIKNRR